MLPPSLDNNEAANIAAAYADETRRILRAEAYIAERKYRQTILVAQSHKISMVKAHGKYQRAVYDVNWFHGVTDSVIQHAEKATLGSFVADDSPCSRNDSCNAPFWLPFCSVADVDLGHSGPAIGQPSHASTIAPLVVSTVFHVYWDC